MCLAPGGPRTSPHPAGPWYVHRPWLHRRPRKHLLPAFPSPGMPTGGWARSAAVPTPASHTGGDVDRVHALGQGALQVLQRVQALHFAAAAIDELPEGVLLEQCLHVLEEEALTEQGQLWGVVDLWGQGEGVRARAWHSPTHPQTLPRGRGLGEARPVSAAQGTSLSAEFLP